MSYLNNETELKINAFEKGKKKFNKINTTMVMLVF